MHCDFSVRVKCTIFGLNRGLRVHFDLYVQDFFKIMSKYFLSIKVGRRHGFRWYTTMGPLCKKKSFLENVAHTFHTPLLSQNMINFASRTKSACIDIFEHKGLKRTREKKKSLSGIFWKIWHIPIKKYPPIFIEQTNGAFCLNNQVSVHRFSL